MVARFLSRRSTRPPADARGGLQAAAEWLSRAQDASGCGGVSAHYDVAKCQWAGAYPETTGYIIPTFFRYADFSGNHEYRERARRMAAWESDIQLRDGGVRAGTMDASRIVPTIFNTGQVLFGWLSAWQQTQDARFRDSAVRAADWLVAAQDPDGAWRSFASPFAAHAVNTYNTRVAFALAKVGHALGEPRYLDAAVHNVQWALTQMRANGWLENNDLEDNERPLTHTIAYATRGILEVGLIAANGTFVDAAARMARSVALSQRRDGALPGRLDSAWRPASRWTCVTGNAQMAIIWHRLAAATGDASWKPAAGRAIGFNLSIQNLTAVDGGVRGGMPGSHPLKGGYMKNRYPNWAAKFFMDALMLQLETD
ncbi:beta-L-arabinofuranosidase domain-containing protein [Rhodanobacter ginsengisoli]|uniref:Beta-L-arabinofuranosidase domain-containing protein n=1 Tax=Rhodanobacter ginsengisoli TaxID=418646 RepID=A0ABW0QL02_9GAMM